MTPEEKLRLATEALEKVADFGHVPNCNSSAPVYECCCFDKDQAEIAKEALEAIGER